MRILKQFLCVIAALSAVFAALVFIFTSADPIFGFSFLVTAGVAVLTNSFLRKRSHLEAETEKNPITRLKEKYPTALPVAIAVSPGVVALFTPAAIAGPVVFGTVIAAIIVGNAIEFFF